MTARPEKCIGIIGAMEEEVRNLCADMRQVQETELSGMRFYAGTLEGTSVLVVQSGVGKVHAAVCTEILTGHFGVSAVLNTGIAGGLQPDLKIGDMVLSTDAVQHDVDVTIWGYAPGQIPGLSQAAFPADEALLSLAEKINRQENPEVRTLRGRIASGDQFIADPMEKGRITTVFDAACAEMEGAAIAQVCTQNHVPFLIIRAISDNADGSAVADNLSFTELVLQRNDRLLHGLLRAL